MLMACASSTHLSPTIPTNLLEPCPELQILESGIGKDMILWSVDTVAKYKDCKARHSVIVEAFR